MTSTTKPELTITRTFNAPRDRVFEAWEDPKQMAIWWGPKDFTNPVCELDIRDGGSIYIEMRAPDGAIYPMSGRYVEIVKPERIVFTSSALSKNGDSLFEVHNSITFSEEGDKTKLTLDFVIYNVTPEAAPHLAGMEIGWNMSLDRLQKLVTS